MLKNSYNLYKKKILFLSPEITWNLYCGNSIWASVFLELLKEKYDCSLTAIECLMYANNNNINLFKELDVVFKNIFTSTNFFKTKTGCNMVSYNFLINYFFSVVSDYDYVIIRSIHIMDYIVKILKDPSNKKIVESIKKKIIYIVIDRPEEDNFVGSLYNTFHMTLIKYFDDKKKYSNIPQYIIPPLLRDRDVFNNNYFTDTTKYDFCTVGTLHEKSNINSMLRAFEKSKYTLIIAGKIHSMFKAEFLMLKQKYKNSKNIIFYCWDKGISKKESENIIKKSKFGIRIDKPVECLSSKVLNYICFNKIPIVQRIKTHELLFGNDYPFYIDINPDNSFKGLNSVLKNINDDNIVIAKERVNIAKSKLNINNLLENNFSI